MHTELVSILSPGSTDDVYSGEGEESWETPTEVSVQTLAPAEPRPAYQGDEPQLDARNTVTSGWTLYLPLTPTITAKNRIRVRGVVYPVTGEPARWDDVGQVVNVTREEG